MKYIALILGLTLIAGCGSTGIVKLEQDTYMISQKQAKVGFVSAAEEKAYVYKEANNFCGEQGKEVETIKLETRNSGFGRQASAMLEFKCVSKKGT